MHVIKSNSEKPADSTGPVLDFMGDKWAEGGCSDTTLLQCFDAAFKKKKKEMHNFNIRTKLCAPDHILL